MIICFVVIFKVYDTDCNGKVTVSDMLNILRDLTGQFISEQQREVGYFKKLLYLLCSLMLSFQ